MHRQADGARLVHDRALDVLADPPGGVGGKAEAAFRVEFLQRVDQAEVALLDQVEQRNAAVQVVLGDVHDQPQVVLDHLLPRLEIARPRGARQLQLLLRRQQRIGADLVQIELGDIVEEIRARQPAPAQARPVPRVRLHRTEARLAWPTLAAAP
jgi:hypothetical protein